ncbi:hypothetical protein J5N97_027366 [Dioscorea zingiberensis]|uniref:Uncharacterized protein n=1 Tax=Dioscorea zingiberensis TaxID=325984 RepID=A0A9D5H7L1_9LILI|nr:hypothetical protein J5N97_027366 [Dioscorea zingiberensis]
MGTRGRRKMHMLRVQPLTPLMEGPYLNSESEDEQLKKRKKKKERSWNTTIRAWVGMRKEKDLLPMRMNLKLMLGVLACPLAPIPLPLEPSDHHFSIKNSPTESTCARYIVHQYLAATGWLRTREKKMKSLYVSGKVKMVGCESVSAMGRNGKMVVEGEMNGGGDQSGCFVLWKMSPAMWLVEMVVEGCKVVAGSNGKVVWRHLPWSGTHVARGPLRPLRRIIQGLDPNTTASMFAGAQCVGEKTIGSDDCFVLKVSTERQAIEERNEASAEVIRHVLYGYFSQRSGMLIYIEDSHLTRVQSPTTTETVYWETSLVSSIDDYREVDGILIAHRGVSTATVFRFGGARDIHSRTKMEEIWRIDDVVFDVPGLSCDCFIPPNDVLN